MVFPPGKTPCPQRKQGETRCYAGGNPIMSRKKVNINIITIPIIFPTSKMMEKIINRLQSLKTIKLKQRSILKTILI